MSASNERVNKKTVQEKEKNREDSDLPIDRGWAWMILIGCFVNVWLVVGYNRSLSLLFVEFINRFEESATTTTLIMGFKSLSYSIFSLVSMHVVLEFLGTRKTVLLGSTMFSLSILCAAFSPNIAVLIVVHFFLGIGQSMIHSPGLVLIGHYFKKRRSLATTTASSAVSFSAGVFPLLTEYLLGEYGLTGTMLLITGMCLNMWVGAALYRPIESFRNNKALTKDEVEPMLKKQRATVPMLKKDTETAPWEDLKSLETNRTTDDEIQTLLKSNDKTRSAKGAKLQIKDTSVRTESILDDDAKDQNILEMYGETNNKHDFGVTGLNKHPVANHSQLSINKLTQGDGIGATDNGHSICHDDTFRKCSNSEGSRYTKQLSNKTKMAYSSHPDISASSSLEIKEHTADVKVQIEVKPTVLDNFKKIVRAFDFSLFKNPNFILITVLSHFAICARYTSLYIPARVNELGMNQSDAAILLLITGCLDFFCRIFYGFLADLKIIKVHYIMAMGLFISGLVNQFMAFFTTFPLLVVYSVLTGIFGSAYQCLLPVVIVELMGLKNMAKTIGFTDLFHGLASAVTHPVIGGIRDLSGSYMPCFMYLGSTSIVASLLLLCEPLVRRFSSRQKPGSTQAEGTTERNI